MLYLYLHGLTLVMKSRTIHHGRIRAGRGYFQSRIPLGY